HHIERGRVESNIAIASYIKRSEYVGSQVALATGGMIHWHAEPLVEFGDAEFAEIGLVVLSSGDEVAIDGQRGRASWQAQVSIGLGAKNLDDTIACGFGHFVGGVEVDPASVDH